MVGLMVVEIESSQLVKFKRLWSNRNIFCLFIIVTAVMKISSIRLINPMFWLRRLYKPRSICSTSSDTGRGSWICVVKIGPLLDIQNVRAIYMRCIVINFIDAIIVIDILSFVDTGV